MTADSLLIDTAAVDSAYMLPRDFALFDSRLDTALIARCAVVDTTATAADTVAEVLPPAWKSGLEPEPRTMQPGNRSGFLLVIALMFVVMAFNFRHLRRLLGNYAEELTRSRYGRDNVFDEHPAGDIRVLMLLILQSIVCTGILLTEALTRVVVPRPELLTVGAVAAVTAIVGASYVVQLVGYNVVGYVFSSPEGSREWVRSYNASQALLGVALAIPAMLAIFYPEISRAVVVVGAVLWIAARLLFIIKGFRIFYTKIASLLYFILYLCTLEIIPVIMVYKCSSILVF